jgi:hypothetical protein
MKLATLTAALLASSAAAFAPAQQSGRAMTTLQAEKSQSLPFMNRPALVSLYYPFLF